MDYEIYVLRNSENVFEETPDFSLLQCKRRFLYRMSAYQNKVSFAACFDDLLSLNFFLLFFSSPGTPLVGDRKFFVDENTSQRSFHTSCDRVFHTGNRRSVVLVMWWNILFGRLFLRDSVHLVYRVGLHHIPTTSDTHIHRY